MAGDWIKMRSDLHSHPKVVRIMSALKADRLRVIGGLHAVWSLFDVHSVDGVLDGYTPETLDDFIGWQGFSRAMAAIGWIEINDESLATPRFDEHNGQSAKRRAQESERKRNERKTSASDADKKRTREEKRREDSKPPLSPTGGKRPTICLKTFLDECTRNNERPVRDFRPLWQYVESVGLDTDMVALAWAEFGRQMLPGGVNASKRQADWRKTFRNYVEKNYLKLWAIDPEGKFFLTTAGKTAQKMQDSREPA
jgi:hypothetical protein